MKKSIAIIKKTGMIMLLLVIQVTSLPVGALAQTTEPSLQETEATSSATPTEQAIEKTEIDPYSLLVQEEQNKAVLEVDDSSLSNQSASVRQGASIRKMQKENFAAEEELSVVAFNARNAELQAEILTEDGGKIDAWVQEMMRGDAAILRILPPAQFRPGKYTLVVRDGEYSTMSQDFTWGVLAINTNKSVYTPEETAELSMAVLDDQGNMVCNAAVEVRIANQDLGIHDTLSTSDGTINVNPECQMKEYTENPDYEATYKVGGVGTYEMTITAQTPNGTRTLIDSFVVRESVPFAVERTTATRIYPVEAYPVRIAITAQEDFTGTITEVVPSDFAISSYKSASDPVKNFDESKVVTREELTKERVLGASTDLSLPFDGSFQKSGDFGDKELDPLLKKKYAQYGVVGHDGMDFALPSGTPVLAADKGTVVIAQKNWDYGTTVVLEHSWGKTYYGHLGKLEVKVGDSVTRGQEIALSGNTGLSTAPHLHFGVKPNTNDFGNGYFGKVDPAPFLGYETGPEVLGASVISTQDEPVQVLSWQVDLKKGEQVTLGYQYKAPEISPQFYTLGPVTMREGNNTKFQEERQWQIAVDATETKYASSHITGSFTNPTNAVGSTTATWAGDTNTSSNYTSRWAMDDPSSGISGTQTVEILARKGSNSGTPTLQVNLYENGTLVQSIISTTNITSTTGQTISGTFAASAITNPNNVEIEVVEVGAGGSPSARNSAQIDYIKWTVNLANASPTTVLNSPADASSGTDTTPTLDFTGTDNESESIEYNVQIDTANTFDSTSSTVTLDSYATSNQSGYSKMYSGSVITQAGQSFTSSGGVINTAGVQLIKIGSPTGSIYAYIYSHSGTYGSTGTPGTLLATSDAVDVSSLPTSFSSLTEFTFSGANKITLADSTQYFIVTSYSSGDINNAVQIGYDNTSPTHGGNYAYGSGSWNASSGTDGIFNITVGGSVPLLDKVSTTDTGFVNPDTAGDTHPFNSGENIQYTVQAGDALSPGTYYWRVRGQDPSGSNTYGSWSSTRSFTIDSIFTQNTYRWYQNADSLTPGTALQSESTAASINQADNVRLRMNFTTTGAIAASSKQFVLQYASSTSGPWTSVRSTADSWCNATTGITCSSSWGSRQKIIFNNTASTETLTNFPVLVKLNSSRIDYSKVQNNGEDLRFVDPSDPTTVLPHEIESWNEAGDSYVWVKVPSISAGSTTGYIWMYYNNAAASNGENVTSVWDSNYMAVYHMAETPDANSGTNEIVDSTGVNSVSANGGMSSSNQVSGQVNGSLNFDGTDDYLLGSNTSSLTITGDMSVSMLFKRTNASSAEVLMDYGGGGELQEGNHLYFFDITSSNNLHYEHESGAGSNHSETSTTTITTPAGSWGHFAFTRDSAASSVTFYENGSQLGSPSTFSAGPDGGTASLMYIARDGASSGDFANGAMDEVRVSNTKRSADYLEAEYKTVEDTFNTYGIEETYAAEWGYLDNATPTDGATITTVLSDSDVAESYTESNPTVVNPNAISSGQDAEWDFALSSANATAGSTYYFRMVKADGTVLNTYTRYPTLLISSGVETATLDKLMRHGKWFNSSGALQPFTF